jgi:hypothetical protein
VVSEGSTGRNGLERLVESVLECSSHA